MANAGEAIRLAVGRYLNQISDEAMLVEVINSGTSASQITDATRLASVRLTPQQFQDWRARVTSGSRDGDLVFARVLTPSTGVLTVSPNFSGALAANDTLELWNPRAPHPDLIDTARDDALKQLCTRWRLVPLSQAVDADFVASGVTNWTGSSATPTKVEKSGLERFAEQTLRVANSGANGYAGQTVNVPRGAGSGGEAQAWFFFVLVQADVGTAEIIMRDLSQSANLSLNANRSTWAGEAFAVMRGTFETDDATEQISVRLGAQGAADDSYWSNLCLYPTNARQFVLPSRITSKKFVGRFYEMVGYDWPDIRPVELSVQPDLIDVAGGGVVAVLADGPAGNRALFFQELAHYAALQSSYITAAQRVTGDAAETDCELDYITWGTLKQLYPGRFESQWRKVHREKGVAPPLRWARRDDLQVSA